MTIKLNNNRQWLEQMVKREDYGSVSAGGLSLKTRRRSRVLVTAQERSAFHRLVRQWKQDTEFTSSTSAMAIHPAYQSIIGLGQKAIPLLLNELKHDPDHWFWALKSITRADPVPAEDIGRLERMADAWLAWGKEEGYIS